MAIGGELSLPAVYIIGAAIGLIFILAIAWSVALSAEVKRKTRALKQANDELKSLCLNDELTRLYNYRYFQERLSAEFKRAKRNLEQLALMFIDIDYFKSINDAYGHKFGDVVLREFADLLKHSIRENDIVFRYSGSRFGILLPATSSREATVVTERIQENTNIHVFRHELSSTKIVLSIGTASYPEDGIATKEELLRCADEALLKAKQAGGNRAFAYHSVYKISEIQLNDALVSNVSAEKLRDKFLRLTRRLNETYSEAINALASAVEAKDYYTIEHSADVTTYSVRLAKKIGFSDAQIDVIKFASILHDIGKIGISEQILLKKGKLTEEEYKTVKTHPSIAMDILKSVRFLEKELPIIRHHHEWWDGSGYPDGLKEEEIPLGARILAIADTYTALVSERSYRKAYSKEDAMEIMRQEKGVHLDPNLTDVFLDLLEEEDKEQENKSTEVK
jgi:diguanylate cyclase (GGDEF)-like protein/putative nucleotidyltransferase with HDIG domain